MNARIVVAGALLILAGAPWPASAQDRPAAAESEEKALDELDEARAQEEVLKIQLKNVNLQLQQWMQKANQLRFAGLEGAESTEENRKLQDAAMKNAEHALDEMTAAYMQKSRELSRTSRRRVALEQQISARAGGPDRKDEEANPRAGALIKAGGTYINPRHVTYVLVHKDEKGGSHAQVYFVTGDQRLTLMGDKADAVIEALERNSR